MIPVNLTKNQIYNAPNLDADQPVSRQYEVEIFGYYNGPRYSSGEPGGLMGAPGEIQTPPADDDGDKHLRSMPEVGGYSVETKDGRIGHVHDLIIDDQSWGIRYIIVDKRKCLSGKKVIVDSARAKSINWVKSEVHFALSQSQLKNNREYEPSLPLSGANVEQLETFVRLQK